MRIRDQKTQITFMDKNIDLIINSKFIGSQQTHSKKSYIKYISKKPLYWESKERERERGSHLATTYRPVGLQWTTHASSEMHQWGWWTPLWWCLDWIWWFWNLRRLELIFVDSPRVSGILRYLYSKEVVWEAAEVGCAPLWYFFGPSCDFWSRKNLQKV